MTTLLRRALYAWAVLAAGVFAGAMAQSRPDPAAAIAAQREAMKAFARMDGVWRGPAWTILPSGEKHHLTQTERAGSFLDGTLKVVEGKGYDAGGKAAFNAFGIISYNPAKRSYSIRTYAQGNAGDFNITPTDDGYVWEIPAGPLTIRYTITIRDGVWKEAGDRIAPGGEPVRFFEMNLKRVGETDWPAGGAVPAK